MCRVLYRKKSVIRGTRELIMELIFYITSRGILTTLNVRNRFKKRHYHEGNILISINLECQGMPPDPQAEHEIELQNVRARHISALQCYIYDLQISHPR
ncbi:hypothetical protein IEO21_03972 [Rhodonia placenta]|uniref:Uncharacterized protein n=1 Tax=Rhodonia placenta TaxID=104341 RepID=A0A8H7U3R2_9APHY|nr:hypothetical protein IEO21_03972 [Postia placenta]